MAIGKKKWFDRHSWQFWPLNSLHPMPHPLRDTCAPTAIAAAGISYLSYSERYSKGYIRPRNPLWILRCYKQNLARMTHHHPLPLRQPHTQSGRSPTIHQGSSLRVLRLHFLISCLHCSYHLHRDQLHVSKLRSRVRSSAVTDVASAQLQLQGSTSVRRLFVLITLLIKQHAFTKWCELV